MLVVRRFDVCRQGVVKDFEGAPQTLEIVKTWTKIIKKQMSNLSNAPARDH